MCTSQSPRLRITVRWMMVAVAVAAIFCAEPLRRCRLTYQRRASINANYARQFREAYEKRSLNVFAFHHGPVFAASPALRLKWAEYHENLSRKYERAASHPWETLPADTPPPEIFPPSSYVDY